MRALRFVVVVISAIAGSAASAQAQSTNLVVDVDSTVRLTCLSPIEFNITAADLSARLTDGVQSGTGQAVAPVAASVTTTTGNLIATLPAIDVPLSSNIRQFELTEVGCLIEANPSFGRVNVRVRLNGNTALDGPGGSLINIRSVTARRFDSGGNYVPNYSYPAWLHFFIDTYIEFRIRADLSAATHSGRHSSSVDGNFVVEVTAP